MLIDASESPVPVQHSPSGAAEVASARVDGERSGQRTVPEYSASFQVKFETALNSVIGFYGNLTFTSSRVETEARANGTAFLWPSLAQRLVAYLPN